MNIDDRQKRLEKHKIECAQYLKRAFNKEEEELVFGEGEISSPLVLVGEAPGEQETIERRPFVGRAGQNLNEFLDALELERKGIYITNVVKFRPFKENPRTGRRSNRPPTKKEVEGNRPWLMQELEIIHPKVIVSLGNTALKAIANDGRLRIGDMHGRPISIKLDKGRIEYSLFPLYHPASIIYRRELAKVYKEDLQKLREYLKICLGRNYKRC